MTEDDTQRSPELVHDRERGVPLMTQALHEETLGRAHDLALLGRLWPYVKPHRLLLGIAIALMPVTTLASLLQPYLTKLAIDAALVERSMGALLEIVAWFAGAIFLEFLARFGQMYSLQVAGQRAMGQLRRDTFGHVQKLRVAFFDRTPIGRVVTRMTNDVDTLTEFFASGAVVAVADIIMLVGIVGFMLYLDWELSLVTFAALPFLAALVEVFRRLARAAFRDIRKHVAQLNAYLNEQVEGIAVVQAFGKEDDCAEEYRRINDAYREANYRSIRYDALLYSVVESVSAASVAIVLWYASVKVGWLDDPDASAAYVGTVVAFYEYIRRFFIPIRDLATKYTIIQSSLASAERIFGLLDVDEPDAPESEPPRSPVVPDGVAVAFRDVTFGYREGHPVLHDVTFDVERGETVALVGATGAGKTTITSLMLRLQELGEAGSVLVEGRDVRAWDRESLRHRFAVIPQDVFLFGGSVLANVALGDGDPDPERARAALQRVGAWTLVQQRGGLEARVDERGANFSAGERQLLAFARALYRDAPMLVLDEATAHVDSETEARLQAAVRELVRDRTAVVIAHRLSTIRHADRILVFHHGELVEQGTHEQLLEAQGVYARLYRLHLAEDDGAGQGVPGAPEAP